MMQASENPQNEQGFICNLKAHWFSIRKLGNTFWDLNSLNKEPKFVSELYLGALLRQLQLEQYSIFVVRGVYPRIIPSVGDPGWVNSRHLAQGSRNSNQISEEEEIRRAINASLTDNRSFSSDSNNNNSNTSNNMDDVDDELMAAIRASLQDVQPSQTPNKTANKNNNNSNTNANNSNNHYNTNNNNPVVIDEFDDELKAALELSLQKDTQVYDVPPEPEDSTKIINIAVRIPDGSRVSRKFSPETKIGQIFSWLFKTCPSIDQKKSYALLSTFPRAEYSDPTKTLSELCVFGSIAFTLVIL